MFFIYSDEKLPFTGRPIPYNQQPATENYIKHFDNSLYLKFMANHKKTSVQEKIQAGKELQIAERKMEYWRRHPNFDLDRAVKATDKLKHNWT